MRRKIWAAIVIVASLAACERQSTKEEQKVAMLKMAGVSGRELCAAQKKVAEAYLDEGNQQKFEESRETAKNTCFYADLAASASGVRR